MVKKKLFAALAVGTFAVAGIAGVALSNRITDIIKAGGTEYSVTLNGETGLTATSTGGTTFDFTAEGLTEAEGKFGTLTTGGYVTLAEGNSLNNLQSFAVVCDNHEAITLSYGFEEGTWVREGLEGWVPSTAGEASLLNEHPNYIRLGAKADVTIESITFTYMGDGANCTTATSAPVNYKADLVLVGTGFEGASWTLSDGLPLSLNSKNSDTSVFEYKISVDFEQDAQFKIVKDQNWDTFTGDINFSGTAFEGEIHASGNSNIRVKSVGGEYTIYTKINSEGKIIEINISAIGAEIPEPPQTNLMYFTPGPWTVDSAWFAAYFFGTSGNEWVKLNDSDSDGIYELQNPGDYANIIFCRMNASKTALDWGSVWNQTADIVIPTDGKNHLIITGWDATSYTWETK